ncbi:MAG: class I SAM-dependent methyltransferase [Burkholderiales bacterium]|nr:class I SAM-dependent methyltransferase [Phycisphaerae bacterium]
MFSKTIGDRFHVIEPFVRAREVMDLGCVDSRKARHDAQARFEYKANLLHKQIAQASPGTLGVDIDPDGVKVLNENGYQVIVADVETMDLGRQFDTIVAGELIEHLESPGKWLRNMFRHLKPGGVIIVSTPNPFYAGSTWKIWRYGKPAVHEEHMGWQDPTTLGQLFKRTGFEPFEGYWVQPTPSLLKTWKRLFRPFFSHTFIMFARRL